MYFTKVNIHFVTFYPTIEDKDLKDTRVRKDDFAVQSWVKAAINVEIHKEECSDWKEEWRCLPKLADGEYHMDMCFHVVWCIYTLLDEI